MKREIESKSEANNNIPQTLLFHKFEKKNF